MQVTIPANVHGRRAMKHMGFARMMVAALILIAAAGNAFSDNYYVNEKTGSKERPWKTPFKMVEFFDFEPGDAVYFARGCTWQGGFSISSSGTARSPILISAYGEGEAPIFTNPDNQVFNGNCIRVRGDHVTIEKLRFHATSDARGDVDIFDIGGGLHCQGG